MQLRAAFADRTILITGNTGFKGSWLSLWLLRMGARVIGYSLEPPSQPNLFESAQVGDHMETICADVRDRRRLGEVLRTYKPDCIFHLAALPLVRRSFAMPFETFDVNFTGTLSLLEEVRRNPEPRSVVLVSTDKCYENRDWTFGYREIDKLGGSDVYSASKAAMEMAVAAYRSSFFPLDSDSSPQLATVRAGNVIGGGDWAEDRLVPDAVRALVSGQLIRIRNPHAVRPWQHVLEPLYGYLTVAADQLRGETRVGSWNFGPAPRDHVSVLHFIDSLCHKLGIQYEVAQDPLGPKEQQRLHLSTEKAASELQWSPTWNLETAVSRTADWYLGFLASSSGSEVQQLVVGDIEAFETGIVAMRDPLRQS